MQDNTSPTDPPTSTPQAPAPAAQPVAVAGTTLAEPPKETVSVKQEPAPAKEQKVPSPTHSPAGPVVPIILAVMVFIALAVCTYFVFKGM